MLQGMHRSICLACPPNQRHPKSWMARGPFKFEADKYKAYTSDARLLSVYLIRWRASEVSEGSSRNWRDTSVLVLSSKCGATMKDTMMFSCSRTSRVARAQRGLMCPIRHIE